MKSSILICIVVLADGVAACASWCNAYTCSMSSTCGDCSSCASLSGGKYCAGWCNRFTCGSSFCSGCDICYVPPPMPYGTWSYNMKPNEGILAGIPLTDYLTKIQWKEFQFEITINATHLTSRTWIAFFGQPLVGPIISIEANPIFYGTSKDSPGGIIAAMFGINVPARSPGLFALSARSTLMGGDVFVDPDPTVPPTGLHLCYDDFFDAKNWYAIKDAFFSWEYLPATDEWQYKTLPVFYCPSSPLDDANLGMGGTGTWTNVNPVMLDPFVKSFYIMLGKQFPKMQRGVVHDSLMDNFFPGGFP